VHQLVELHLDRRGRLDPDDAARAVDAAACRRRTALLAWLVGRYHPAAVYRRTFVTGLGAMLAAPLAAEAQQASGRKIGYLSMAAGPSSTSQAFREGLRNRGWIEAQNITIEYRFAAGNTENSLPFAKELVNLRVDVILAAGNQATHSAKTATTDIPIVMAHSLDPVGSGLVGSLAKPRGNVTGLTWDAGLEIAGKRLELLKQVSPGLSRVVNLWDPREPGLARYWPSLQLTAKVNGVVAASAEVRKAEELPPALADARDHRAGICIWAGPLLNTQSKAICDFALTHRLPTISAFNDHVSKDGCLIGYAPVAEDLFRRAATYVDRLLRGAKPADLPIEQPTTYELVINAKTAKALGLAIPPSLLLRADQVIE
jgi:putative tryptophan/tyrosine transport system substrate-binding protein